MLFKSITVTLLALIVGTSAWPTSFSLLTRDASADPVAVAATEVTSAPISGAQVAILNVYNTTSTSTNIINGAKKCQTKGALAKLENGVCWSTPNEGLGIKLTSIVAGCKVYGYATTDCTGDSQQISGATCYDVSSDTGTGPASLVTVC